VNMLLELWTDPEVMRHVGFPQGLRTDSDQIREQLVNQSKTEYDCVLAVSLKSTGELIGQCKLGSPDKEGAAGTDVKLMPRFWGNKYGVEIKKALVDYLFTHTSCDCVTATPNVNNPASIHMQEAVGGRRMGEKVCSFPEHMADYTTDVHYYDYRVFREDWSAGS